MLLCVVLTSLVAMATSAAIINKEGSTVKKLVLFPEKHAWCETQPIKQVVGEPGCNSVEVNNNVCLGQCISYRVPKTYPAEPSTDELKYCDVCKPSNSTWQKITLDCPEHPDTPQVSKLVELIEHCRCQACDNGEDMRLAAAHRQRHAHQRRTEEEEDPPDLQKVVQQRHTPLRSEEDDLGNEDWSDDDDVTYEN
ncbi:neuroblastoma suppressor of tumorigenicity 1-like isoform X2 [Branchiostoma lanceolatum]|uniref:NBL1 protein n=1 Tax=Branchiostoma lanceolatum TaxID=7740 RepID=A0A8J9VGQ4_BRALA|nr:NBL1 [Branchiostoma lanceolatum]